MQGISRNGISRKIQNIGIGYIMIPSNVVREDYIENCYIRERVCIYLEQSGGMAKDCYITQQALRDIYFPESEDQLGSAVIYVADSFNQKPIIIATISKEDESQLLSQERFKIVKGYENNTVKVEGDAEKGVLNILVDDREDYGTINIKVKGKDGGVLNIDTGDEVNINADEKVTIKTTGELNLNVIDSVSGDNKCSININDTDVEIKPENELKIGEFTEPVALADTLADILNDLIHQLSIATTSTMLGPQPLLNASDISAIANRLEDIKSKTTKTD